MNAIDHFLEGVRDAEGSDLHLSPGIPPRVRVHGVLIPQKTEALTSSDIRTLLEPLLAGDLPERLQGQKSVDLAYEAGPIGRFRVNIFDEARGMSAVFRHIPAKIFTPAEIMLPEVVGRLARLQSGLVLLTGTAGSGKSTTLTTLVDLINSSRAGHIITIEDPIEVLHENKLCIVSQREVGPNVPSFAAALKNALRQDPNVIVVGELRDAESVRLAITAAETGHLVLATLHSTSGPRAVERIIDEIETHRQAQVRSQLADTLRAVVAQKLLPRASGEGRIPAHEILLNDPAIAHNIRTGNTHAIQDSMNQVQTGMQTMETALALLVVQGQVQEAVARLHANDDERFTQALRGYNWRRSA